MLYRQLCLVEIHFKEVVSGFILEDSAELTNQIQKCAKIKRTIQKWITFKNKWIAKRKAAIRGKGNLDPHWEYVADDKIKDATSELRRWKPLLSKCEAEVQILRNLDKKTKEEKEKTKDLAPHGGSEDIPEIPSDGEKKPSKGKEWFTPEMKEKLYRFGKYGAVAGAAILATYAAWKTYRWWKQKKAAAETERGRELAQRKMYEAKDKIVRLKTRRKALKKRG